MKSFVVLAASYILAMAVAICFLQQQKAILTKRLNSERESTKKLLDCALASEKSKDCKKMLEVERFARTIDKLYSN